jgi:hypothetical protein
MTLRIRYGRPTTRHGRACPGHLRTIVEAQMARTSPAMTGGLPAMMEGLARGASDRFHHPYRFHAKRVSIQRPSTTTGRNSTR